MDSDTHMTKCGPFILIILSRYTELICLCSSSADSYLSTREGKHDGFFVMCFFFCVHVSLFFYLGCFAKNIRKNVLNNRFHVLVFFFCLSLFMFFE